jgi:hypothetical protein
MKYLKLYEAQQGENLNWHDWNRTIKNKTQDFTELETEQLERFKKKCVESNYDLQIFKDHIIFMPIKYKDIMEGKSEIWKHDGFFTIQRSRMIRRFGDSYEEGLRQVFKCVGNEISDIIGHYNIF